MKAEEKYAAFRIYQDDAERAVRYRLAWISARNRANKIAEDVYVQGYDEGYRDAIRRRMGS